MKTILEFLQSKHNNTLTLFDCGFNVLLKSTIDNPYTIQICDTEVDVYNYKNAQRIIDVKDIELSVEEIDLIAQNLNTIYKNYNTFSKFTFKSIELMRISEEHADQSLPSYKKGCDGLAIGFSLNENWTQAYAIYNRNTNEWDYSNRPGKQISFNDFIKLLYE